MRKWDFVKDYANWFDTVMVVLSILDIYLLVAAVQNDGARQSVAGTTV